MAITSTRIFAGKNLEIWDVTATLDADAAHVINHGLPTSGAEQLIVFLVPILQAPAAASAWGNSLNNDTDIRLEKSTAVGSGDAAAQLRVVAFVEQARQIG